LSTEIIVALIGAAAVIVAAVISFIGSRRSSPNQSTGRTPQVPTTPSPAPTPTSSPIEESLYGTWYVTQSDNILHIAYGTGNDVPEYAALHLESSYFRMNYGPPSVWGTFLILLPAFWSKAACSSSGGYCLGAQVKVDWHIEKPNLVRQPLVLTITGTIGGLSVSSLVNLSPPTKAPAITARIKTTVTGSISLDTNRPGEAFKPIMLASMRVSATQWDTWGAYTDKQSWPLPQEGWIILPPVSAQHFGLKGGTSAWKNNAPTIDVLLDQAMPVTGWVTKSVDPNDENVGLWAASDTVLTSWSFTVTASQSL
jgi:hypothetical protein